MKGVAARDSPLRPRDCWFVKNDHASSSTTAVMAHSTTTLAANPAMPHGSCRRGRAMRSAPGHTFMSVPIAAKAPLSDGRESKARDAIAGKVVKTSRRARSSGPIHRPAVAHTHTPSHAAFEERRMARMKISTNRSASSARNTKEGW